MSTVSASRPRHILCLPHAIRHSRNPHPAHRGQEKANRFPTSGSSVTVLSAHCSVGTLAAETTVALMKAPDDRKSVPMPSSQMATSVRSGCIRSAPRSSIQWRVQPTSAAADVSVTMAAPKTSWTTAIGVIRWRSCRRRFRGGSHLLGLVDIGEHRFHPHELDRLPGDQALVEMVVAKRRAAKRIRRLSRSRAVVAYPFTMAPLSGDSSAILFRCVLP